MNKVIKLTKGLDIPMEGKAEQQVISLPQPEVYAIVPDHYAGIKPKMLVREGDVVKAGSALFCDKSHESMLFVSPVSGKVIAVERGDRRKVMAIRIEADKEIEYEHFATEVKSGEDVKALLLKAGMWSYLKQRPYDCIAMPEKSPKAIFISAFDSAPLAPDYDFVVKGQTSALQAAVDALSKIAPVYIGVKAGAVATEWSSLEHCTLTEFAGAHPAGNVSVQINHVLPIAKGETVYTVNAQDLLIIGRFLTTDKVDMQRLVALTGPKAAKLAYFSILPGMPIEGLLKGNLQNDEAVRVIEGNAVSGHKVGMSEIM